MTVRIFPKRSVFPWMSTRSSWCSWPGTMYVPTLLELLFLVALAALIFAKPLTAQYDSYRVPCIRSVQAAREWSIRDHCALSLVLSACGECGRSVPSSCSSLWFFPLARWQQRTSWSEEHLVGDDECIHGLNVEFQASAKITGLRSVRRMFE